MARLDRITFDPKVLSGRACVRGLLISVALVVNLLANGLTQTEILNEYPDLEAEDISQALRYAATLVSDKCHPYAADAT